MLYNQSPKSAGGHHMRQNSAPTTINNNEIFVFPANQSLSTSHQDLNLDQPDGIGKYESRIKGEEDDLLTTGLQSYQQHQLQETHKQQTMARPGRLLIKQEIDSHNHSSDVEGKLYPEYSLHTSHHNHFAHRPPDQEIDDNQSQSAYDFSTIKARHSFDPSKFAGYLEGLESVFQQNSTHNKQNENLGLNRAAHHERLDTTPYGSVSWDVLQRPRTPQSKPDNSYFPMTPDTTPFARSKNTLRMSGSRTAGSSPTRKNLNLTIKASQVMKRGSSFQDGFYGASEHSESLNLLSPPNSGRILPVSPLDLSDFPRPLSIGAAVTSPMFLSNDFDIENINNSPRSVAISSTDGSFQLSPTMTQLSLQFNTDEDLIGLPQVEPLAPGSTPASTKDSRLCPSAKYGSHSRAQSVSDIEVNAIIEDTGITSDEIEAFIRGPNPIDSRWTCEFPSCNRTFGRKENIKSHVQTHLGDRQYRCMHCGNTFVRQHDLKRHAKIHSGVKPYPCPCGRSFARHDALTRHRQRNTCIGGFEGMTKKPSKRGRPRKVRPDTDERLAKASKTRQKVLGRTYASSVSSSSESSFPSPPAAFDCLDLDLIKPSIHNDSSDAGLSDLFDFTRSPSLRQNMEDDLLSALSGFSHTPKAASTGSSPKVSPNVMMSRDVSADSYSTASDLELLSSPTSFLNLEADRGADAARVDLDLDQMLLQLGGNDAFLEKMPEPLLSGNSWDPVVEDKSMEFFTNGF